MRQGTVMVISDANESVLLLKRSDKSTHFPGEWCLPGGKIDDFEDPHTSVWREVKEETGIELPLFIKAPFMAADGKFMVHVFGAPPASELDDLDDYEVTTEFPNREHSEYGWFNRQSLPDRVGKLTKHILKASTII